ncbi:MAG: hypothetical protein IJZ64_03105 [Ruminococcus sp.]|nr:hypothetical protein [Ruminococcus sp.]
MANDENLVKAEDLTPRERRENASKAGKASAAARRRKKDMKAKMKLLLSLKPNQSQATILDVLGIPEEDADNEMLMLVSMFQAVVEDRDTKAFSQVMDVLGKSVRREELELKKKSLKQKNTSSTGKSEKLIQSLMEVKENDLHEETTGADDAMEEE